MEKLIAEARASGNVHRSASDEEQKRLSQLPEVRAKLAEMMAQHFERWVDQPLPALNGRTPMQAVEDADGRDVVESLVAAAERLGRNMERRPMTPSFGACASGLGCSAPAEERLDLSVRQPSLSRAGALFAFHW